MRSLVGGAAAEQPVKRAAQTFDDEWHGEDIHWGDAASETYHDIVTVDYQKACYKLSETIKKPSKYDARQQAVAAAVGRAVSGLDALQEQLTDDSLHNTKWLNQSISEQCDFLTYQGAIGFLSSFTIQLSSENPPMNFSEVVARLSGDDEHEFFGVKLRRGEYYTPSGLLILPITCSVFFKTVPDSTEKAPTVVAHIVLHLKSKQFQTVHEGESIKILTGVAKDKRKPFMSGAERVAKLALQVDGFPRQLVELKYKHLSYGVETIIQESLAVEKRLPTASFAPTLGYFSQTKGSSKEAHHYLLMERFQSDLHAFLNKDTLPEFAPLPKCSKRFGIVPWLAYLEYQLKHPLTGHTLQRLAMPIFNKLGVLARGLRVALSAQLANQNLVDLKLENLVQKPRIPNGEPYLDVRLIDTSSSLCDQTMPDSGYFQHRAFSASHSGMAAFGLFSIERSLLAPTRIPLETILKKASKAASYQGKISRFSTDLHAYTKALSSCGIKGTKAQLKQWLEAMIKEALSCYQLNPALRLAERTYNSMSTLLSFIGTMLFDGGHIPVPLIEMIGFKSRQSQEKKAQPPIFAYSTHQFKSLLQKGQHSLPPQIISLLALLFKQYQLLAVRPYMRWQTQGPSALENNQHEIKDFLLFLVGAQLLTEAFRAEYLAGSSTLDDKLLNLYQCTMRYSEHAGPKKGALPLWLTSSVLDLYQVQGIRGGTLAQKQRFYRCVSASQYFIQTLEDVGGTLTPAIDKGLATGLTHLLKEFERLGLNTQDIPNQLTATALTLYLNTLKLLRINTEASTGERGSHLFVKEFITLLNDTLDSWDAHIRDSLAAEDKIRLRQAIQVLKIDTTFGQEFIVSTPDACRSLQTILFEIMRTKCAIFESMADEINVTNSTLCNQMQMIIEGVTASLNLVKHQHGLDATNAVYAAVYAAVGSKWLGLDVLWSLYDEAQSLLPIDAETFLTTLRQFPVPSTYVEFMQNSLREACPSTLPTLRALWRLPQVEVTLVEEVEARGPAVTPAFECVAGQSLQETVQGMVPQLVPAFRPER